MKKLLKIVKNIITVGITSIICLFLGITTSYVISGDSQINSKVIQLNKEYENYKITLSNKKSELSSVENSSNDLIDKINNLENYLSDNT